jgi:hypothetical protein
LELNWHSLSELNQFIIKEISKQILGITTKFEDSRDYYAVGTKQDRLMDILIKTNADEYISGPAAKDYIIEDRFIEAGIKLIYKDYANYPVYNQLFPPFDPYVTILDLIFNTGKEAPFYIWGWKN